VSNSNEGDADRRALLRIGLGGALALAAAAAASGGPVRQAASTGAEKRLTRLSSAAAAPLPATLRWPPELADPSRSESTPAESSPPLGVSADHPWHRPAFYVQDLLPSAPSNAIALTIDDGPDPIYTPMVLEILRAHGVKATFSMIGINVQYYPQTARQVVAEGHSICNHSMFHPIPFAVLTRKQIHDEVAEAMNRIWDATKVVPRIFRSPGGDWSSAVFQVLAGYDLAPLDWDVDPRDWALPGVRSIEDILDAGRGGDILLCHDGGGNRIETVRALHQVIPALLARKLEFVTL
jgi:peptidoglycan-N-acetylglucosamine deacetylase